MRSHFDLVQPHRDRDRVTSHIQETQLGTNRRTLATFF